MKATFNLNGNNSAIVAVEYIMQKPSGLVVVGKVLAGSVTKGDTVSIQANGKEPISDEIVRIESYGNEIIIAGVNKEIGILLKNTSKEKLAQYFS